MEVAWLAAVVLIPVFFDRHSANGFEPGKLVLLRCLALVLLAAWLVRLVEQGLARRESGGNLLRSFAGVPLAVLALANIASTWFSIDPTLSLWGSYESRQGTYTLFSYLVILAAIALNLRRPGQIQRLVTTAIIASLPVALYGIIQRAGYDPVDYQRDNRVFSTAGQPVYLAAYLGMILPLSLWRIQRQVKSLRQPRSARNLEIATLGLYVLVALAQTAALACTESRGPLLGLIISLALIGVLLAVYWNRRRQLVLPVTLGALTLLLLLLLNISNGPLERLRSFPLFKRLSEFSPSKGTAFFRTDLWKEAPKLMLSPDPLPYPGGGNDPDHRLRAFLGYGLETLAGVLPHHFSVRGPNPTIENRFHNLVWDLWFTVGPVGAAAFLMVFASVFFYAYCRLRWILSRGEIILFWTTALASAGAGAIVLTAWQGAGFAGLGLQLGLVAGLAAYPLISRRFKPAPSPSSGLSDHDATLMITLLSALAGHMVETGFAFEVSATSTLFWMYTGITLAVAHLGSPHPIGPVQTSASTETGLLRTREAWRKRRDQRGTSPVKWGDYQPALLGAVVTALILVTMLFSFIHIFSRLPLSAGEILSRSLAHLGGANRTNSLMLPLLLLVWIVSSFALTVDGLPSGDAKHWTGQFWASLVISGGIAVAYALFKAGQLATIGAFPTDSASASDVLSQCAGYEKLYLAFILASLGILLLGGIACSLRAPQTAGKSSKLGLVVALVTLLGAVATACITNLNIIRADVCLRWAEALHSQGVRPGSIDVFRRAVSANPKVFLYRSQLSQALRDQAETAADEGSFSDWMRQAEQVLVDAQKISTLNRGAYHLGCLYMLWAAREKQADRRLELARKASQAFDQALVFEPKTEFVWNESANVDLLFLNNEQEAIRKNQRGFELALNQDQGAFGDFYAAKSLPTQYKDLQKQYAVRAIKYYDNAISRAISAPTSTFPYQAAKGDLFLSLNDPNQALACYLDASKTAPTNEVWRVEEKLARTYSRKSNKAAALQHVQLAIDKAPSDKTPLVLQLKEDLQK